jgi:uncharacterized membrane protein YebE (DUF533 family)
MRIALDSRKLVFMSEAPVVDNRLKGMLARIFSDGVVDANERAELDRQLQSGAMKSETVRATLLDFLATTMKHVTADGVVSDSERAKLRVIVTELELPNECIPDEVRRAIR